MMLPGFPVKKGYDVQTFQWLKLPAYRSQWHVQSMVGASQCLPYLLYGYTCHLHNTTEGLRATNSICCCCLDMCSYEITKCISDSLRCQSILWQFANGQYLHNSGFYSWFDIAAVFRCCVHQVASCYSYHYKRSVLWLIFELWFMVLAHRKLSVTHTESCMHFM